MVRPLLEAEVARETIPQAASHALRSLPVFDEPLPVETEEEPGRSRPSRRSTSAPQGEKPAAERTPVAHALTPNSPLAAYFIAAKSIRETSPSKGSKSDPKRPEVRLRLSRDRGCHREITSKEEARSKWGFDGTEHRKTPRPFVISGPASLITPSWNSVVGFLTDWEGLRRLAA